MNDENDEQERALFQALRHLPRAAPDPALDRRVHRLAAAQLAADRAAPDMSPPRRARRLLSAAAPALLAVVVTSYFGWSVCFLLASRIARLG